VGQVHFKESCMRQTGLAEPRYHGNQAISHARGCTSCDRWAGSHNLAPWRLMGGVTRRKHHSSTKAWNLALTVALRRKGQMSFEALLLSLASVFPIFDSLVRYGLGLLPTRGSNYIYIFMRASAPIVTKKSSASKKNLKPFRLEIFFVETGQNYDSLCPQALVLKERT